MGPRRMAKFPSAGFSTSVPMRSAGSRSGRELDANAFDVEGVGEARDREALGEAGDAFDEHVPGHEQADEEAVNEVVLADHGSVNLLAHAREPVSGRGRIRGEGGLGRESHRSSIVATTNGRPARERIWPLADVPTTFDRTHGDEGTGAGPPWLPIVVVWELEKG